MFFSESSKSLSSNSYVFSRKLQKTLFLNSYACFHLRISRTLAPNPFVLSSNSYVFAFLWFRKHYLQIRVFFVENFKNLIINPFSIYMGFCNFWKNMLPISILSAQTQRASRMCYSQNRFISVCRWTRDLGNDHCFLSCTNWPQLQFELLVKKKSQEHFHI